MLLLGLQRVLMLCWVLTSFGRLVSAGECPAAVAKATGKDLGADELLLEQQVSSGGVLNLADTPITFWPWGVGPRI